MTTAKQIGDEMKSRWKEQEEFPNEFEGVAQHLMDEGEITKRTPMKVAIRKVNEFMSGPM